MFEKKCVAYLQEDFLFTIDTLCKILKKCVFEQFFQISEILKFKKKMTGKIQVKKIIKKNKSPKIVK
jgi:hypothetical protein